MNQRSWLEERLGLGSSWTERFNAPVHPSIARVLAFAFGTCVLLACLSGVGLAFVYSPGSAGAWGSTFFAEYILPGGWYVRSLHKVATDSSIVIGVLMVAVGAVERLYRYRRELSYWALAAMVGLVFVFCVTGNPLRWDNRGYFGFVVESNIIGGIPVIGGLTRSLLVGGAAPGNWTLTRLFALHTMVLPVAIGLLGYLALRSSRRAGEVIVAGEPIARRYGEVQLPRDILGSLAATVLVAVLAYFIRAPLETPADPLASYNARPEWYFLGLYVLRMLFPVKLQGLVFALIPAVPAIPILLLPWLDREGSQRRWGAIAVLLGSGGLVALLTVVGIHHDNTDKALLKSQAADAKLELRAKELARQGIPFAGATEMMRNDPLLRAEAIFKESCASCHKLGPLGPPGNKKVAPALDGWGSEKWVIAMLNDSDTDDKFGKTGYKGQMPSYTHAGKDVDPANFKPMAQADQEAIARYLAHESDDVSDPNHDADGAKLIASRCTTCHVFLGKTDDTTGAAPDLTGWGSVAWIKAQVANPSSPLTYRPNALAADLQGHMPRFDDKLSADDISLVARYVWYRVRNPGQN